MGYLTVYDNGNCNGMPYASMKIDRGVCEFYPNGNCNGIHIWSMRKTSRYTEVYRQPGLNGIPDNYFEYISPGRFGGLHGGVEFYPNGNGNGTPVFFFSFKGDDAVEFYPTGNANGTPEAFFEQRGRTVYYYQNGNGNGIPIYTIGNVNDIRDVVELVFYLFIPQGIPYCPSGPSDQWNHCSSASGCSSASNNSFSTSSYNSGSSSVSGRQNPRNPPPANRSHLSNNSYSAPSAFSPRFAQLVRQAQLSGKLYIIGSQQQTGVRPQTGFRLQTESRPQPASSAASRHSSPPGRNSILSGILMVIKTIPVRWITSSKSIVMFHGKPHFDGQDRFRKSVNLFLRPCKNPARILQDTYSAGRHHWYSFFPDGKQRIMFFPLRKESGFFDRQQ